MNAVDHAFQETLNWLYAIETAANDFGEVGDWEAQEFFCEWFAALRHYYFSMSKSGEALP